MAQYEKLINLSLLNQFLTKAKTIFAPKITASGILKGDGNGGVSAATAGTDYVTPAQSLALGLTGASVGNLVRVNTVDATGKPTSWKHVPLCEIKTNPNLLDNWYFVGGGSQLGDVVFPINQRGQTIYAYINAPYGIDRWRSTSIELTESCIRTVSIVQVFDHSKYVGQKMTASVLCSDGRLLTGTAIAQPVGYNTYFYNDSAGLIIRLSEYWKGFQVATTNNTTINIIAVKLELGSEQTLAHNEGTKENPVWVLNEIPDYGEELRKCQRYYYRIAANAAYNTFAQGFISNSSNRASFLIYFPVPMASAPTPKYSGIFGINSTQFGDATHYNTSTTSMIANAYFIANYNVPQGTAATLQDRGNGNTVMEFSAEP